MGYGEWAGIDAAADNDANVDEGEKEARYAHSFHPSPQASLVPSHMQHFVAWNTKRPLPVSTTSVLPWQRITPQLPTVSLGGLYVYSRKETQRQQPIGSCCRRTHSVNSAGPVSIAESSYLLFHSHRFRLARLALFWKSSPIHYVYIYTCTTNTSIFTRQFRPELSGYVFYCFRLFYEMVTSWTYLDTNNSLV